MQELHGAATASRYRIWWGAALVAAFFAASVWMIEDMRQSAWRSAERAAGDLLQAAARGIDREVEILDLSVRALARGMAMPELGTADPALRRAALFDASAAAHGLGILIALDQAGVVLDASDPAQVGTDLSDRPYFLLHRDSPDPGLRVTGPFRSRLTGRRVVALSRRISDTQGGFLGVAVGTIHVRHLHALLGSDKAWPGAVVRLRLPDGTSIVRETDVAPTAQVEEPGLPSQTQPHDDGEERLNLSLPIARAGLVLDVSVPAWTLMAEWRNKAGLLALTLLGLSFGMGLFVVGAGRELARQRESERLARELAETDPLTGLANRRRFDRALCAEGRRQVRGGAPLSLVVLDVDRFKDLNDALGHGEGDRVLCRLSHRIGAQVRRPGEIACRIGGEEFAVILPGTDLDAASAWAEQVRRGIEELGLPGARGAVTVSIGVAQALPGEISATTLARADAALYEAKRSGRNRVGIAPLAA